MHNPIAHIDRERKIRAAVEPNVTKIMRQWERGLITCEELVRELATEVMLAEAATPLVEEQHRLLIEGSDSRCSCGWQPESACPQDQVDEFDLHTGVAV